MNINLMSAFCSVYTNSIGRVRLGLGPAFNPHKTHGQLGFVSLQLYSSSYASAVRK